MAVLPVRMMLSAQDTDLISEMSTTTEASNQRGGKSYYPQVKDKEHATDAVRAARLAIEAAGDGAVREPGSYGGWAGTKPFYGVEPDADFYDDDDDDDGQKRERFQTQEWHAPW